MNYKEKELEKAYGPNYSELINEKFNINSTDREYKIQYDMYPVLTPQGQFGCPRCFGSGKFNLGRWNDKEKKIEPNFIPCISCGETGLLCEYQRRVVCSRNYDAETLRSDKEMLLNWIKKNSTCKTCRGNQGSTPGGCPCEECGLIGTQPWGG
jgi:hypothetical protein